VSADAVEGVTGDDLVRYAAIEVTVADEEVVQYTSIVTSELEAQLDMGGKYNTNYIYKGIEPEYSGPGWDGEAFWYYGVEEGVLCEENCAEEC
jgi:hypothetical protein